MMTKNSRVVYESTEEKKTLFVQENEQDFECKKLSEKCPIIIFQFSNN
jgi:hypothetical protein